MNGDEYARLEQLSELLRLAEQDRDTAIRERDEALAKLARAEDVAHWSEQAMIEAHDRCAELRESAKSARWNAVYGAMVAAQVSVSHSPWIDMKQYRDHSRYIADQAEEAWEKQQQSGTRVALHIDHEHSPNGCYGTEKKQ